MQLDKQLVYVVDQDNEAAWAAVMRIATSAPRPGQVIPLSAQEFAALKSGVIALAMPEEQKPILKLIADLARKVAEFQGGAHEGVVYTHASWRAELAQIAKRAEQLLL